MAAFQADDGYEEPHVIAEIGCNHMGQFEIAKELLTLAKNAGATVGKFQKRCPKELLTEEQYNAQHPNPHNSYGDTYGAHREFLELDVEQHRLLQKHCEEIGLLYSCSVWDTTSAKEIASLNPPLIKVGSPSNQHWEMQKVLRDEYSGMVHISTGMTTKDEVEKIVSFWEQGKGNAKERVILYNCTSGYPVPFQDVCMLELKLLRERFAGRVRGFGFSGHHLGISVDIAAYALGATWNERHFTKDRTWKGTDHAASLAGGLPGVLHGNRTYLLQDNEGQIIEGHSISAGLDYPGIGPEHAYLRDTGRVNYVSATDAEALEAFQLITRLEGIIPALEPSHALAHVGKIAGDLPPEHLLVMNMCGRGDKDVFAVADHLNVTL